MLVLNRTVGEAVRCGEDVEVIILGCHNGKVKLGFRAKYKTKIVRSELADPVAAESQRLDVVKGREK